MQLQALLPNLVSSIYLLVEGERPGTQKFAFLLGADMFISDWMIFSA